MRKTLNEQNYITLATDYRKVRNVLKDTVAVSLKCNKNMKKLCVLNVCMNSLMAIP